MRIPLPVNYGAMPGGYVNPAQISNAQAAFAPMQAQGNALLPLMQAQYTPYQMYAQAMSNPMMWMAAQSNPGMMQNMMNNLSQAMPKTNMLGSGMFPGGGGLLGGLMNHLMGNQQQSPAAPSSPAPQQAAPFDASKLSLDQMVQVQMPDGSMRTMTVQQARALGA